METKKFCGFLVKQRQDPNAVRFFVFSAYASDISGWATIDRAEDREGGIQRRLSEARMRAVERFFKLETKNVIPTSVVLAFKPGCTKFNPIAIPDCELQGVNGDNIQWGAIEFQYDPTSDPLDRPAFVVDGQHRILGMAQIPEPLPLLVSALLEATSNEQAFQFIVINNKVSRVPADLVRTLIADFNEEELQTRLETARITLKSSVLFVSIADDDSESPFHKMIDWPRRRNDGVRAIKPAAIDDSLKYIRYRFGQFEEDQDALIDFFFGMWKGVKDSYPQLWENPENNLFENAGFKAFSEYLTEQLDALAGMNFVDIKQVDSVQNAARMITGQINVDFWQSEWGLKSLDTSAGRSIIKDDINVIRQNRKDPSRQWYAGTKLIPGE